MDIKGSPDPHGNKRDDFRSPPPTQLNYSCERQRAMKKIATPKNNNLFQRASF